MQTKHWLLLSLIIFFVILLRLPSLFEPYWYGDEGIYLTIGQTLRRGAILYKEIYDNKPPPIYLLTALAYEQFNFRLLTLFWVLTNTAAIFFLAKKLTRNLFQSVKPAFPLLASLIFGILASIPLFEGSIPNGEIFMILPVTLAFLIVFDNKKPYLAYLSAGVLISLAVLFKFPSFFDFAALGVFLLFTADYGKLEELFSKFSALLIGFLAPLVLTLVYFILVGALPEFLDSVFVYNLTYISGAKPLFFKNDILIFKTLLLFAFCFWLYLRRQKLFPAQILLFLWLIFSFYGTLFGGRAYPHYFIQVIPALSLILGYFLLTPWVWSNLLKKMFVGAVVLFFILVNFFTVKKTPEYYLKFLAYIGGGITQKEYFNYFDWRTSRNYALASYLAERSSPSDLLFIWGDEPELYALSDRQPATRYTVAYHLYFTKNAFFETSQVLNLKKPKYIIKMTNYPNKFPDLDSLLSKNYQKVGQIQDAEVYRRTNFF